MGWTRTRRSRSPTRRRCRPRRRWSAPRAIAYTATRITITPFAAVAALSLGELSNAARELNVIRQGRHRAVYDWSKRTDEQDLARLRAAVLPLFTEARRWIVAERPRLASTLDDPA